jgi:hypothetical protein
VEWSKDFASIVYTRRGGAGGCGAGLWGGEGLPIVVPGAVGRGGAPPIVPGEEEEIVGGASGEGEEDLCGKVFSQVLALINPVMV